MPCTDYPPVAILLDKLTVSHVVYIHSFETFPVFRLFNTLAIAHAVAVNSLEARPVVIMNNHFSVNLSI